MQRECVPFSTIPHTSQLFLDFVSFSGNIQQFYRRTPRISDWLKDELPLVSYEPVRRQQVAAILQRQNHAVRASSRTLENISRLQNGAHAIVSGQQVGLFGGPLLAMLKAISAIAHAERATALGVDCVPIFWMASEDHDLAEVNHAWILGQDGLLHMFSAPTRGMDDAPVGEIRFGNEIEPLVEEAIGMLGASPVADTLRECYRPGETLGSAFAKLFARLFSDFGLIIIDPSDPELHRIAEPVICQALQQRQEIAGKLLDRDRQLAAAGYHQQVRVTQDSVLLFDTSAGRRLAIQPTQNGFSAGDAEWSREQMLARCKAHPEYFSANVLLRPAVQDFLLPTLAYVGGPSEIAYFAQAGIVQEHILRRATPVLPRLSATLVEPRLRKLLDKYKVSVAQTFEAPDKFRELMAARSMPSQLQARFDAAEHDMETALAGIMEGLQTLDPTLVDAARNALSKMQYQMQGLRGRAARAELRRSEELNRHAEILSAALYPNKTLQERVVAGTYFLACQGLTLLQELHEAAQAECTNHQLIYM